MLFYVAEGSKPFAERVMRLAIGLEALRRGVSVSRLSGQVEVGQSEGMPR